MELVILPPEEWKLISKQAHEACFNEGSDPELERIDYALMVVEGETPLAYSTIKELDARSGYMQYGGAFPSCAKTSRVVQTYDLMVNFLKSKYDHCGTLIENTNKPMLKLAMSRGWLITGLRVFGNSILLEHKLNCKE